MPINFFPASRGNFLYVDLVLSFFKEGKLQVKSSSFGMIPMTLSEVFLLAFNLKYPSHEAFLKVKDLICIMTASLRPLTSAELFDCINALKMEGLTQQQFDEKMKALSWLVRKRANGTLTFFHPTVWIDPFFRNLAQSSHVIDKIMQPFNSTYFNKNSTKKVSDHPMFLQHF